jgi:hypothetical protein
MKAFKIFALVAWEGLMYFAIMRALHDPELDYNQRCGVLAMLVSFGVIGIPLIFNAPNDGAWKD